MTANAKSRRIDQVLSSCGYCSRSEARQWVAAGRVTIDGRLARAADERVPVSQVRIDGEPVEFSDGLLILMHKPAGCVCSRDEREGPAVYELLPSRWSRRHPPVTTIGRLDRDTTGVLLLTDNGALVQRWTSPRHKVPKVYDVTVEGELRTDMVDRFASGNLPLAGDDEPCRPARLTILDAHTATLELVEGRYHQVKRMFASQGCTVTRLHRSRFAGFDVAGLQPGQWRSLPLESAKP